MNTINHNAAWREKKDKGLTVCRQIRDLANLTPFKKPVVKEAALNYWENELQPLFAIEREQMGRTEPSQAFPQYIASLMRTDHELITRIAERIQVDGDARDIYLHFANLAEQHLVFGGKYVF
jgi:hypothetical protein